MAQVFLGNPLKMDEHTARMLKTEFAHVCVEVYFDFKFPTKVPVDLWSRLDVVKTVCKWKLPVCENCCRFGHQPAECPESVGLGVRRNAKQSNSAVVSQRTDPGRPNQPLQLGREVNVAVVFR